MDFYQSVFVKSTRFVLTLFVFFINSEHVSNAEGDEKIELTEMGTGGGAQGVVEEGKKLEDAGTQKEHVPGEDEPDHTEVRQQ